MHRNDFIVSVQPVGGRAYREFKIDDVPDTLDIRTRRINVPFYQEYEFAFTNMKNVRRSVNVNIDGNDIGTWIVGKGDKKFPSKAVLERFMDSNKRFKVLPLSDGGVDDPSNPDNGVITIAVVDEAEPILKCFRSGSITRGVTYGDEAIRGSTLSFSANAATGEGSYSGQTFSSTTWNGNVGTPIYFVFRINGTNRSAANSKQGSSFCHECGAKMIDGAKFCHSCGTKVAVMA